MPDVARRPLPPARELRRIFAYDAETGALTWRHRPEMARNWNARFVGKVAGRRDGSRGVSVSIDGVAYLAHRLIFKMLHGVEPPIVVDHANRRRDANTPGNLRAADKRLNSANSKDRDRELPRGVYRCANSKCNPYRAQHRQEHLGVFPTVEAASAAFKARARELYGDFANA